MRATILGPRESSSPTPPFHPIRDLHIAVGGLGAGLGDRLIVIRAALYMAHRKQRLLVQSVQDPFTFVQEQSERATPTKLLALQPQSRGPDEGSYQEEEEGDDAERERDGERGGCDSHYPVGLHRVATVHSGAHPAASII